MNHDSADNHDMSWADAGRCSGVDPDLFFPQWGQDTGPAKALCRQCPVRTECLGWALETGQKHGIWGGMTESQRRRLRRPAPVELRPISASPVPASPVLATQVRHLYLVR